MTNRNAFHCALSPSLFGLGRNKFAHRLWIFLLRLVLQLTRAQTALAVPIPPSKQLSSAITCLPESTVLGACLSALGASSLVGRPQLLFYTGCNACLESSRVARSVDIWAASLLREKLTNLMVGAGWHHTIDHYHTVAVLMLTPVSAELASLPLDCLWSSQRHHFHNGFQGRDVRQ